MTNGPQYKFSAMDGEELEIGEKVQAGVDILRVAIECLARGVTRSFSLTEVDERGRTRKTLVTTDGAHLGALADAVLDQSKVAFKMDSMWQGNAPIQSRSFRQH